MVFVRAAKRLRERDHVSSVESAWAFLSDMKKDYDVFSKGLFDPRKTTLLPYPGISDPGPRPGYEINFIGTPNLQMVLDAWNFRFENKRNLLVVGAKGIGKSCVMRAFACLLYVAQPENVRLVCIWNVFYARLELFQYLKDALYFTYFQDKQALQLIDEMKSISDIKCFLHDRIVNKREVFLFLLDGAQALDSVHWTKRPREDDNGSLKESRSLLSRFLDGYQVIWVLSPECMKVEDFELRSGDDTVMVTLDQGFGNEALQKYKILSLLLKNYERDVSFYAGRHPLLLEVLEDCCREVAAKSMNVQPHAMDPEDAAGCLEDDEGWGDVINAFLKHNHITSIQRSLQRLLRLEEGETYYTLDKMISLDSRYALNEGQYCSSFIQQLYTEVFRAKERHSSLQPCGPWVDYCSMLLSGPIRNWSEMGWLCERLCADVISRLGIHVAAMSIKKLVLQPFSRVPMVSTLVLGPGQGYVCLPVRFINFSHVDAVIVYQNVDHKKHLIGLQFTTSVDSHLHSENEFMSIQTLEEWIPYVCIDEWDLHFAFICLKDEQSEEKPANLEQLRSGVVIGTVHHWLHIVSFQTALKDRVGERVLKVLQKMVELREPTLAGTMGQPPADALAKLSPSKLKKLKRSDLNTMARDGGMDLDAYKKKDDLIGAMLQKGILT